MNPRYLLLTISLIASSLSALGDPPTAAQLSASATKARRVADGMVSAKALFKSGDITGGEAALFVTNRHQPGTAGWSRDCGSALIGMACAFQQDGDVATANALASRAMDQLVQARASAGGDTLLAASVYTYLGFLQEHFRGDRAGALASYRAAVDLSPKTAKTAATALSRIHGEEAHIALRTGKTPAGK